MNIEQRLAEMAARLDALERENAVLRAQVPPPEKPVAGLTAMEEMKVKELARDVHRLMSVHGSKGYDMAMAMHGRRTFKAGRQRVN